MIRNIKDVVRRLKKKTVCDIYTCRNMASYSIGHPLIPVNSMHVCKDCIKVIFDEARELIAEDYAMEQELKKKQESVTIVEPIVEEEQAAIAEESSSEVEETQESVGEVEEVIAEIEEVVEEVEDKSEQSESEDSTEMIENEKKSEKISNEIKSATEKNVIVINKEVYTCKYCGETFEKTPEGLSAYRSHLHKCKSKTEAGE